MDFWVCIGTELKKGIEQGTLHWVPIFSRNSRDHAVTASAGQTKLSDGLTRFLPRARRVLVLQRVPWTWFAVKGRLKTGVMEWN